MVDGVAVCDNRLWGNGIPRMVDLLEALKWHDTPTPTCSST